MDHRALTIGALTWVLDHQGLTLLVFLLTLALTAFQFVEIPKGFFPDQDTGEIQGISYAAQDISFAEMARKQQALADAILNDPDVVGAVLQHRGGRDQYDTEHRPLPHHAAVRRDDAARTLHTSFDASARRCRA